MKIEDYIKNALEQVRSGCNKAGCLPPEKVEFLIQLNAEGNVCGQGEMAVSSVKMVV